MVTNSIVLRDDTSRLPRIAKRLSCALSCTVLALGMSGSAALGHEVEAQPHTVGADRPPGASLGERPRLEGRRVSNGAWYHLLSEELDRDAFAAIAELDSLIKAGSWKEAAGVVARGDLLAIRGVAPSPSDGAHLVSVRTAVRGALARHPELVAHVEQEYGELARIRVEQAIDAGQLAPVERLADQFFGTGASNQAFRWLGDQALARGLSARALHYYRQVRRRSGAGEDSDLIVRIRLAGAIRGERVETPLHGPAWIGGVQLTRLQVDQLIDELVVARSADRRAAMANRGGATLPIGPIDVVTGRVFEFPSGTSQGNQLDAKPRASGVDWNSRHLTAVKDDDLLLVSNRFQLTALEWATGKLRWETNPLEREPRASRDWLGIAMRPVRLGKLVMARQLDGASPWLACWRRATGDPAWVVRQEERTFVSDPFTIDGQVGCFTLGLRGAPESPLHLVVIDKTTGAVRREVPLLRVRDRWWRRMVCELAVRDRRVYVALGGISFCCDAMGTIHWIRKTPVLPPDKDPASVVQRPQRPVLIGDRMVVAQPGTGCMECLDATTGRRHWRSVVADMQAIVGVVDSKVILQCADSLRALDLETGAGIWHDGTHGTLLAAGCDAENGILVARVRAADGRDEQQMVELVWVDLKSGRITGTRELRTLSDRALQPGPLVASGRLAWLFFSGENGAGQRELIKLTVAEGPRTLESREE